MKKTEAASIYYGGEFHRGKGEWIQSVNPTDGSTLFKVRGLSRDQYDEMVEKAHQEFLRFRQVPAPQRGQLVFKIGQALRERKEALGTLVSQEMGKILDEGQGEIQEAIDIADYAVGLSRQLYGVCTHSERVQHRMYEQWHPLGVNAYVTAFNFPVAVWAWNAMIGLVCGNSSIWKPSPKTPRVSLEVIKIVAPILQEAGFPSLINLATGGGDPGTWIAGDKRIPLVSFTGSCRVGRIVARTVSERLGRSILELGGNNAVIITENADLKVALPFLVFGSVGTTGQRCTSTRRLIIHESIQRSFTDRVIDAYRQVTIGDPLKKGTLVGPLVDRAAVDAMQRALAQAKAEGGEVLYGGRVLTEGTFKKGCFVEPALVLATPGMSVVQDETFAPILYVLPYRTLQEAIEIQNSVTQGLSSAIFTTDMRESEEFLSATGSDCGIANVNTGTSGAEIGLAFGGEKETGGGREAGSDSWKLYMRRQTTTINWGRQVSLAQGIKFDL